MGEHELNATARASVSVMSVAAVSGAGRLMALATVQIDIDGVVFILRGIRLMKQSSGNVTVELPVVRDATGKNEPLIDLPPEIAHAIDLAVRREVIETVAERIAANATHDPHSATRSIVEPGG